MATENDRQETCESRRRASGSLCGSTSTCRMDDGAITDDTRIRASLPTCSYLRSKARAVVLMSHLGQAQGRGADAPPRRRSPRGSSELLGRPRQEESTTASGEEVEAARQLAGPGEVLLLENLRFHPEEEANDPEFAKALARSATCT